MNVETEIAPRPAPRTLPLPGWLKILLLLGALGLLIVMLGSLPPLMGFDYYDCFRPALEALLRGHSPYAYIYNPPWVLLLFLPIYFLPPAIAFHILFLLWIGVFFLAFERLQISLGGKLLLFLSPAILFSLVDGNVEAWVLLGFTLPPVWGLFLVLLKPQMGFVVALYWAVEAYRQGGWRQLGRTFAPVSAALLASLVIFGPWPLRMTAVLPYARDLNQSWWPYSIPFGLGLGWLALRRRDKSLAMIAAPLLSPYVLYYAWAGALAGLLADGRRGWALAAVALADVVLIAYLIAVGP